MVLVTLNTEMFDKYLERHGVTQENSERVANVGFFVFEDKEPYTETKWRSNENIHVFDFIGYPLIVIEQFTEIVLSKKYDALIISASDQGLIKAIDVLVNLIGSDGTKTPSPELLQDPMVLHFLEAYNKLKNQ